MKVGIDPGVLLIQPDAAEAMLAPARGIWPHDLLSRMAAQEIARSSEFKLARFVGGAPDEVLEKMRTFEPPVPESSASNGLTITGVTSLFVRGRKTSRAFLMEITGVFLGAARVLPADRRFLSLPRP